MRTNRAASQGHFEEDNSPCQNMLDLDWECLTLKKQVCWQTSLCCISLAMSYRDWGVAEGGVSGFRYALLHCNGLRAPKTILQLTENLEPYHSSMIHSWRPSRCSHRDPSSIPRQTLQQEPLLGSRWGIVLWELLGGGMLCCKCRGCGTPIRAAAFSWLPPLQITHNESPIIYLSFHLDLIGLKIWLGNIPALQQVKTASQHKQLHLVLAD